MLSCLEDALYSHIVCFATTPGQAPAECIFCGFLAQPAPNAVVDVPLSLQNRGCLGTCFWLPVRLSIF